jgi:hypothetical protein
MKERALNRSVGIVLLLLMGGCATQEGTLRGAGSEPPGEAVRGAPRVYLAQSLHLSTPDGRDIILDAGRYEVMAGGTDTLRVVAVEGGQETLVQATETALTETVTGPAAGSMPNAEDPDLVHLVFVHPDGKALEAIGSLSGVQSRALSLRSSTTLSGSTTTLSRDMRTKTIPADKFNTCPLRLDYGQPESSPPLFYVVDALGHANWLRHNGASEGIPASVPGSWDGPMAVEAPPNMPGAYFPKPVPPPFAPNARWFMPGGVGTIYEITTDGDLLWRKQTYQGYQPGVRVDPGYHMVPGPMEQGHLAPFHGWQIFLKVFSGWSGVIYGIGDRGELVWHKHKGWFNGENNHWEVTKNVSVGQWANYKHVFSGGWGVIYAVTDEGALKWYKHTGYEDGAATWQGPFDVTSGLTNYTKMFSVGRGLIYGVEPNGNLIWYKDSRYQKRTQADQGCGWSGPIPVGSGWNYPFVFGFLPFQ